jgi:hypothetical protein
VVEAAATVVLVVVFVVPFTAVLVTVTTGLVAGLPALHSSSSSSSSSSSGSDMELHHESRIQTTDTNVQPTLYHEYGKYDDKWQSGKDCMTYTNTICSKCN